LDALPTSPESAIEPGTETTGRDAEPGDTHAPLPGGPSLPALVCEDPDTGWEGSGLVAEELSDPATTAVQVEQTAGVLGQPGDVRSRWWLWWSRLPAGWCLFALTGVASVAWEWRVWRTPRQVWIGETGDTVQFIWLARWLQYAWVNGDGWWLTTHANFPIGVNLMWQPTPVLPNLLVLPVTVLGGPVLAYNVLATLAIPAAALGGYLACRRLVARQWAAAVGGLVFGLSPFLLTHLVAGHVYLDMTVVVALAFVLLHEMFVRQVWRFWVTGALLGALGAATLVTAEEFLAYDGVFGLLGLALLAALAPTHVTRARLWYAAKAAAVGIAVFTPLVAYPLYVQFRGPHRLTTSGLQPHDRAGNDLLNLITPTHQFGSTAGTGTVQHFVGWPSEWCGYIGVPMLLLIALIAVAGWRHTAVRFATLLASLATVFGLGVLLHIDGQEHPAVWLPWAWLSHIPLLSDAIAARSMAYADLAIALLAALYADRLPALAVRSRALAGAAAALLLAAVASWLPSTPPPTMSLPQPAYFAGSPDPAIAPGQPVLIVPFTAPARATERWNEPLLWQALAGMRFRIPEGYFVMTDGDKAVFQSPLTPVTGDLRNIQRHSRPPRTAARRQLVQDDLNNRQLAAIILGPSPVYPAERDYLTWAIGRPPDRTVDGVDIWYHP
jgi:hypothetical protein